MLERARLLHAEGYSIVLIDLQAHGESPGKQITVGHLEKHDARAAVEFARQKHPNEPIAVVGVSLGGASALLASPLGIDALVLESVYPNLNDAVHNRVAAKLGPLSSIPAELFLAQLKARLGILPSQIRPIDHLPNVSCAVLLISGNEDRHTTTTETKEMFAIARQPKELWMVDGAAHVDLYRVSPVEYKTRVVRFLNRYMRTQH
jgi:alpha-beta hydrolase superfamily lysophospholipase